MKNTKHQAPNTRKAPGPKHQTPGKVGRVEVSYWGASEAIPARAWVLRDSEECLPSGRHPFDLEERTAVFGEAIVRFVKRIPRGIQHPENNRLVDQIVGAATSIGANYCEANDCVSKKDFLFTIKRCIKEAKEARFFLRMIAASEPSLKGEARDLYREANEFVRIFASMHRK